MFYVICKYTPHKKKNRIVFYIYIYIHIVICLFRLDSVCSGLVLYQYCCVPAPYTQQMQMESSVMVCSLIENESFLWTTLADLLAFCESHIIMHTDTKWKNTFTCLIGCFFSCVDMQTVGTHQAHKITIMQLHIFRILST